jgi:tryptophan synthase alpha chain
MSAHSSNGIERIRSAFEPARAGHRAALMPFITAGYPDLATTERILAGAADAGADLLEIGFPFSDPIADGPVIAESMHQALLAGTTPDQIFEMVARKRSATPMIAMVSISIVGRMGLEAFVARAVSSGFAGFIVPDADPSVAAEVSSFAAQQGAGFCALVSPSTPTDRLERLARLSTGFVYLLARAGVTGERNDAPEIAERVRAIRALTDAPIVAGFGISTAAHVTAVGQHADGAIVGSAIVRRMKEAVSTGVDPAETALQAIRSLRAT